MQHSYFPPDLLHDFAHVLKCKLIFLSPLLSAEAICPFDGNAVYLGVYLLFDIRFPS